MYEWRRCKERITLEDNAISAAVKLSEGNPGATTVCMEILKNEEKIDPDYVLGGTGILLLLDTYNIYGPRIWMLYKDVCKGNIIKTIASLRACQMGLFPIEKLQYAIDRHGEGMDPEELHKMVKEKLPRFLSDVIHKKATPVKPEVDVTNQCGYCRKILRRQRRRNHRR